MKTTKTTIEKYDAEVKLTEKTVTTVEENEIVNNDFIRPWLGKHQDPFIRYGWQDGISTGGKTAFEL